QYVVREGERLVVDRVGAEEGKTFQPGVLFVGGDGKGQLAPSTSVTARVIGHVRGEKVRTGKRRPKSGYRRQTGVRAAVGRNEMAHKKGVGSSRNGGDSNPKMIGVKIFSGQDVKAGMIIVRQRGTKFRPGPGAGIGRDDTIFATRPGTVAFRQSGEKRFVE